jgi:hypothetical protein
MSDERSELPFLVVSIVFYIAYIGFLFWHMVSTMR